MSKYIVALTVLISFSALGEGVDIPFPGDIGFVLLNSRVKKTMLAAMAEAGIENPVLSVVRETDPLLSERSLHFFLKDFHSQEDAAFAKITVKYSVRCNPDDPLNVYGIFDIQSEVHPIWKLSLEFYQEEQVVRGEVAAVLIHDAFEKALAETVRPFNHGQLVIRRIQQKAPGVYQIDIGLQGGLSSEMLRFRVEVDAAPSRPLEILTVEWQIVDTLSETEFLDGRNYVLMKTVEALNERVLLLEEISRCRSLSEAFAEKYVALYRLRRVAGQKCTVIGLVRETSRLLKLSDVLAESLISQEKFLRSLGALRGKHLSAPRVARLIFRYLQ